MMAKLSIDAKPVAASGDVHGGGLHACHPSGSRSEGWTRAEQQIANSQY